MHTRHADSIVPWLCCLLLLGCGGADNEGSNKPAATDVSQDTATDALSQVDVVSDAGGLIEDAEAADIGSENADTVNNQPVDAGLFADSISLDAAIVDADRPDTSGPSDVATDAFTADSSATDSLAPDSEIPDSNDIDAGAPDSVAADAGPGDSSAPTDTTPVVKLGAPYPIILAHGFFGTDNFAGLNFATYFFGVKADLKKVGEPNVFTPAVDPFNNSTSRGKALLAHVKAVLAKTGHAKVNIIGHSQGGLDARYVASVAPNLVASVVTVATPHKGSPVADIILKLVPYPGVQALVDALVKLIGKPIYTADGKTSSVFTALQQFSPAQAKKFNAAHPNAKGVSYYSVAGRSGHTLATKVCKADEAHQFIVKLKYNTDPIEPLLALSEAALDGTIFNVKPNDGLVRVEDAKWGTFLGCVPADHMDEVGHLLGDKPGLFNPFDHKAMFRWLVKMLRLKGF